MFRVLLILVLLPVTAVAAPVPKSLKKSRGLDGTWVVVGQNLNETVASPKKPGSEDRWVITGQVLSILRGGRPQDDDVSYALVAPPGGASNALDYVMQVGKDVYTTPAMSQREGDTLLVALGTTGKRPINCEPGWGILLYTLQRVADDKR